MIQIILASLCLLISALTYNFHDFTIDYWKTKPVKELAIEHPRFKNLRQIYLVLQGVFFVMLIAVTILLMPALEEFASLSFLLIVPFINTFKVIDGMIGLSTGIYFTGYRGNPTRYYYDANRQKIWVAYLQISLAMSLSLASLILYFWK